MKEKSLKDSEKNTQGPSTRLNIVLFGLLLWFLFGLDFLGRLQIPIFDALGTGSLHWLIDELINKLVAYIPLLIYFLYLIFSKTKQGLRSTFLISRLNLKNVLFITVITVAFILTYARDRKRRNAYIKTAKFDIIKTFENYTFEDIRFPPALSPDDIMGASFIPLRENLILYGNVGAGKTHLAIATGVAACGLGFRTRFWRTAALVNALTEAKKQGFLSRFMKQFSKLDLLICDEWGYVPIYSDGSKLLFQVISECYERKSLIITTNLEFARWNDIFADTKITAALLDRIIHHSHLLDFISRDSRRLKDALINRTAANSEDDEKYN